jgi:hypothetical protein
MEKYEGKRLFNYSSKVLLKFFHAKIRVLLDKGMECGTTAKRKMLRRKIFHEFPSLRFSLVLLILAQKGDRNFN